MSGRGGFFRFPLQAKLEADDARSNLVLSPADPVDRRSCRRPGTVRRAVCGSRRHERSTAPRWKARFLWYLRRIKTLTPRVRPSQFGERLELTEEEAAAIAAHWKTNLASDDAPSDPNREAPAKGGTGIYAPELTGAAGKVGGYNAFYIDIGESAFKIDGKYRASILIDPPNGRYPARTELGKKALARRE